MKRKKFVVPFAKKPDQVTQNVETKNKVPEKNENNKEIDATKKKNEIKKTLVKKEEPVKKVVPKVTNSKFKPPKMISKTEVTKKTKVQNDEEETEVETHYWSVMYTKRSNKKHKTYDDGFLTIYPHKYVLLDTSGKTLYQRTESKTIQDFKPGQGYELGQKELEFVKLIPSIDFISGKCFFQETSKPSVPIKRAQSVTKKFIPQKSSVVEVIEKKIDPTPNGAYVLNPDHPKKDSAGNLIHDVYIDPKLSKLLRDYQLEGVQFMYDCVMGNKDYQGKGVLLADEMGLGKSVQTVTLIWTLLKRGLNGKGTIKKAIVVTNSSIVKNWRKEFKKWLGDERLKPLVASAKTTKVSTEDIINDFKTGHFPVLIISYDLCVRNAKLLQECRCDLLVCDEGHKLKNKSIKIYSALKGIKTTRKVILSGTPLQNNLDEFFCVVDFINPGLLVGGDASAFSNLFTNPISKSREPSASKNDKKIGSEREKALNDLTNLFILRRTNTLLTKLLPPKKDLIVFCGMSDLQKKLYLHVIKSKTLRDILYDDRSSNNTLSMIQNLKNLLTHPNMIYRQIKGSEDEESEIVLKEVWKGAEKLFPKDYNSKTNEHSNKMIILFNMLEEFKKTNERIVIVSNFTTILDEIQLMLTHHDYTYSRLDGSTSASKRQDLIDAFNVPTSKTFAFLLSAKAGGFGINLIGANRLILFDPDWNPSVDLQAMARVYREGQKKNVFVYRFISTGTIEEKIFQRQIVKTSLSDSVVDEKKSKSSFSKEMLRELFIYKEDTICSTYPIKENEDFLQTVKEHDPIFYDAIINNSMKDLITYVKNDDKVKIEDIKEIDEDDEDSDEDEAKMIEEEEEEEEEFQFDNEKEEEPENKKRKLK